MSDFRLPDTTRIGAVRLRVSELERSLAFYRDLLGLRLIETTEGAADLSATGERPALLKLREAPGVRPKPRRTAGLYHFAILLPERRELARMLLRLSDARWPLQGASDHAVSEAIYLADPDGSGIELYADRPREAWPRRAGELAMTTEPLDVHGLLAGLGDGPGPWTGIDPETTIGHIHLHVSDLQAAEAFYHGLLGLDVVVRGYPGALFLSAGGYHHHLGLNTWAGREAPPAPQDAAGLIDFELVVPEAAALERVLDRLREGGLDPVRAEEGWWVADPSRNAVVLRS